MASRYTKRYTHFGDNSDYLDYEVSTDYMRGNDWDRMSKPDYGEPIVDYWSKQIGPKSSSELRRFCSAYADVVGQFMPCFRGMAKEDNYCHPSECGEEFAKAVARIEKNKKWFTLSEEQKKNDKSLMPFEIMEAGNDIERMFANSIMKIDMYEPDNSEEYEDLRRTIRVGNGDLTDYVNEETLNPESGEMKNIDEMGSFLVGLVGTMYRKAFDSTGVKLLHQFEKEHREATEKK